MVKLLWAFDFSSPVDESTGQPYQVDVDLARFTTGNVMRRLPFPLSIKVRSAKRAETIDRERAEVTSQIFDNYPESKMPAGWPHI